MNLPREQIDWVADNVTDDARQATWVACLAETGGDFREAVSVFSEIYSDEVTV